MALFDTGENNVGQFGADNSNIIRYKQAAEYAEDARLYALAAAESMTDADNLLNRAEEILTEARDILTEIQDIEAEVEGLEARVAAAEAIANEAVAKAQQAIDDTAGIIAAAQGYADAAQASSNTAQGFSQAAAQSATAASNAVTQAQGYRDEASGFADEAETHVTEAETAVGEAETQADRAKSEADRAAEILANTITKDSINGFAKVYKNKTDADDDLEDRTLGDKVLVWDNDTSVYAWYDITGTVDSKALTLNSTEKKLSSVNNIQPDDSGNVQITLPSGNPSLWLGETVLFQYDPDKNVSYPGLLPQDGREVNRADYPDLWASIAQNYIPNVTEAEWQAGKKNCFSTGNGTTTFRVPLWNGEVIRTPNSGDEKGEIVSQIPYVVTVNNIAPDDTTGNVQIDAVSNAAMTLAINNATANKAAKGINSDITGLTALSGPLRLGADGSNAFDAVTLRQLQASSGGGSGANLTGVMNNFLGAVEWFNGSRAVMPSGHIPADGQLLNRADYPDLWAAINAGVFISVDDTTWLNSSGSQYVHRAKYSTGNGSTTFRVPDLNGQVSGSIIPFLRGDGGGASVGVVYDSGAPNITGSLGFHGQQTGGSGATVLANTSGSLVGASPQNNWVNTSTLNSSAAQSVGNVSLDASKSSSVYGRANEIRPQSAIGIWLIRANGSYSAANTNFAVINGDASLPSTGTVVYGGDILSKYQVNGADNTVARIRSKLTVGGAKNIEIGLVDGTGNVVIGSSGDFATTGDVTVGGNMRMGGGTITQSGQMNFINTSSARQTLVNMGVAGGATNVRIPVSLTQAFMVQSGTSIITLNSSGETTFSFPTTFASVGGFVGVNGDANVTGDTNIDSLDFWNMTNSGINIRARSFTPGNGSVNRPSGAYRMNWVATGLINI